MTVSLVRLPRSGRGWLHATALPYLAELAPDLGELSEDHFDIWWQESARGVWQILSDSTPSGFALIREDSPAHYELSEFCILPEKRGDGIGTRAADMCFSSQPGQWTLGVAAALPGTARFWDRVLSGLPGIAGLARGPALTPYQSHSYTFAVRGIP